MKKVLVCGGRDFNDRDLMFEKLEEVETSFDDIKLEIVSGGAKGADYYAEEYADEFGHSKKIFKPNWEKYSKSASYIRNRDMLKYISDDPENLVLAFWNGSGRGTKYTIDTAKRMKIKTIVIKY